MRKVLYIIMCVLFAECSNNKVIVDYKCLEWTSIELKKLHSGIISSPLYINKNSNLIGLNQTNITHLEDINIQKSLSRIFEQCGYSDIYMISEDCVIFKVEEKERLTKTETYFIFKSTQKCVHEYKNYFRLQSIEKIDQDWSMGKQITTMAN